MAVTISLPLAIYHGFMGRCKLDSRQYAILRNALIAPSAQGSSMIEILCSREDAELLLVHSQLYFPSATVYVSKGIEVAANRSDSDRQYRKAISGDTWHFHPDCAQWPTQDFLASQDPHSASELCNECIAKDRINDPARD